MANALSKEARKRHIDILTLGKARRIGHEDREQLEYAHKTGRVWVTVDKDFLILNACGVPHSGIVFISPKVRKHLTIGKLVDYLALLAATTIPDQMAGQVEYAFDVGDWAT